MQHKQLVIAVYHSRKIARPSVRDTVSESPHNDQKVTKIHSVMFWKIPKPWQYRESCCRLDSVGYWKGRISQQGTNKRFVLCRDFDVWSTSTFLSPNACHCFAFQNFYVRIKPPRPQTQICHICFKEIVLFKRRFRQIKATFPSRKMRPYLLEVFEDVLVLSLRTRATR